jgi:flagellar hook-basal body protein
MSFFTSLTGLNAATAQLGVTSNNIANASTVGFKRSRADFGDIFATSPLQKATSTIGQGVSLKRVTQEFGQGNMNFSSNTLDLAISGDGFFPLKSADGFQDIFTRNGSFMMNDQYNVVNSAGQRLMAASVDSTGKANLSDMNVLTIPQKTTGMAKETSLVQLGLNFPADAQLVTKEFNRNDPATYNKSTALTVYDKGGNGYLATVYYAKTQNASQADPNNKWQTYVYVGDTLVAAALQQATDPVNGENMYVNKYGQLKPESEVSDLLVNTKTQKFSLNQLTDKRTSEPAQIAGDKATGLGSLQGIDFSKLSAKDLTDLFQIDIDNTGVPASIGLEHLAGKAVTLSGVQIAKELTNVINRKFGDEHYFNFSDSQTFSLSVLKADTNTYENKTIQLDSTPMTYEQVVAKINAQLNGSSSVLSNVGFNSTSPSVDEFKNYSITIDGKKINGTLSLAEPLPNTESKRMDYLASELETSIRSRLDASYTDEDKKNLTVNIQNGNEVRVTFGGSKTISDFSLSTFASGVTADNSAEATLPSRALGTETDFLAEFATNSGTLKFSISVGDFSLTDKEITVSGTDPTITEIETAIQAALQEPTLSGAGLSASAAAKVTLTTDASGNLFINSEDGTSLTAFSLTDTVDSTKTVLSTTESTSKDITNIAFTDPTPSADDFQRFSVTIDGTAYNNVVIDSSAITTTSAATALTSMATHLQSEIRALLGDNDISVTADTTDNKLTITDAQGRYISDFSLIGESKSYSGTVLSNTSVKEVTLSNVSFGDEPKASDISHISLMVGDHEIDVDLWDPETKTLSANPMDDLASAIYDAVFTEMTDTNTGMGLKASTVTANLSVKVINGKDIKISYTDPNAITAGDIDSFVLSGTSGTGVSYGGEAYYAKPLTKNNSVDVSYDPQTQKFSFTPRTVADTITLDGSNAQMGILTKVSATADALQVNGVPPITTDTLIRSEKLQRYGASVEYDTVNEKFIFKSGTTGDESSIKITPNEVAGFANDRLGILTVKPDGYEVKTSATALRGISSQPAVMQGSPMGINANNNFSVNETNNKFVVSVDDVKGTIYLEKKDSYTIDQLVQALQNAINRLAGPADKTLPGTTGSTVSGVKVSYDKLTNSLKFTSGTASTNSFIKVSGDSQWGLANVDGGRGSTSTWIKPTQYTQIVNGVAVSQYIDEFGQETFSPDGFKSLPEWSPIFLEKGELTFDTGGNLVSPKQGSQLDTVYLPDGKGALTININYSKSTQFSSPYAVLSQSQDGAPEGDLVGLSLGDDGLVNASYSNGSQKSLGKVVLVNFSNPTGLRQIGDTSYYKSASSGTPKYGEAGSAGFGTVRSGATERANVDLTQELVDLITEQRNFQANAKAIETSTTLTQSIIQIRA